MFYYFNAEMKYYEKPYVPPSFADGSDEEIAIALQKYYNDELSWQDLGWSVGDTRLIHLDSMQAPNPNSGTTLPAQNITVVIVDHDHTDLATPINGHTKACITVQTREVLNNYTNDVSDGVNGIFYDGTTGRVRYFYPWEKLYMRSYLNDIVWGAFSIDFKSSIKPSEHYRHTAYNNSASRKVTDTIFLPSYPEIFGTVSTNVYIPTDPVEGTQFEYFQITSNRIKYGNNNGSSNGTAVIWWNGSPSLFYDSSLGYEWCVVNYTGSGGYGRGAYAFGLAPAFAM